MALERTLVSGSAPLRIKGVNGGGWNGWLWREGPYGVEAPVDELDISIYALCDSHGCLL